MKKKKDKKKLTKKQIIILIVVTIVLGTLCYFISTEITKSIIDHKTMEERLRNEEYPDLIEPDTISNISLNDLINNFNEISEEDIDINSIVDNKTNMNDIEIEFYLNESNVNIISINFNKKSDAQDIITDMIIANNENITEETTALIYDRVFETLGNTNDEESKTSEFFQYQGLEFSLKEFKEKNNYKYSFRIGRIIEEENKK